MTLTHTYVRTYTVVDFADPYLVCGQCRKPVTGWAPDSPAPGLLYPCEHYAEVRSTCPSWGPVDGCTCLATFGYLPHRPGQDQETGQ